MIKIYHNPNFLDNPFLRDETVAVQIASSPELQHVANLDTDDINKAFELTNHIDHDWRENDGVTFVGTKDPRSSSVGDVFEKDGIKFVVAACGFIEVVI